MSEFLPKNEKGDLVASMTQRVRKDIFCFLVSQSQMKLVARLSPRLVLNNHLFYQQQPLFSFPPTPLLQTLSLFHNGSPRYFRQ